MAGWSSVIVLWTPDSRASRSLKAHNDNPNNCLPEYFAPRVELVQGMTGNVVSQVTASLGGGPFDGACLAVTTRWIQPGGCDLTILSQPSNPELQTGCARR